MEEISGGKYLTFALDSATYGIPIQTVREIIGIQEITYVPKTKKYMKGIMNLRGKIIPIIDLRLKFAMVEKAYTDRTCIIVIEVNQNGNKRLLGIVVDSVNEVHNFQKEELEAPGYNTQIEGELLLGLGKSNDKVIMMLNIEKIMSKEDTLDLKKVIGE
ncbi:MAG TPA: chemotaxis protein CheW [Firmicutes bacterium]|jgi:purine-binding chemotaxis protein CheW|nr:chemotaxis protein CheW [Bacillota bacterium]